VKSQKSAASSGGTDVLTYHNDTSRTGANLNETTLTPQNVNAASFGKLFNYDLDGQVYAQPLVVSNLRIDGKVHNVPFMATENDSVYALDANNPTAGPRHNGVLWQTSFIDPAKGITPVPSQDVQNFRITPMYGITAIAPPSRRTCWRANYSATRRALSPAPTGAGSASSSSARAAPSNDSR
jgi:hypothetical protein